MDDGTVAIPQARMPDGLRVYAIGDVHGYAGALDAMHWAIAEDLSRDPPADWRIVHIGDFVDRGPDSRGVIDMLVATQAKDDRVLTLRGNHDHGFVDFLERPDHTGLFACYGGVETARSYGIDADMTTQSGARLAAAALERVLPISHRRFLEALPLTVTFGDYFFCHAGIRPGVALEAQSRDDLIWIRDAFLNFEHPHPKVIVHGHTPVEQVDIRANRINVDTGIHKYGNLSAVVLDADTQRVLTCSR
jgi:serine/threonine protein phosphatase 1